MPRDDAPPVAVPVTSLQGGRAGLTVLLVALTVFAVLGPVAALVLGVMLYDERRDHAEKRAIILRQNEQIGEELRELQDRNTESRLRWERTMSELEVLKRDLDRRPRAADTGKRP